MVSLRGRDERGAIDPFTRFWNSTFGIPEQLLRRLLRAGVDPEADLFGPKGLLTADLIPLASLATEHKHDVLDEEWIEILNKSFGTDMKNNLGTQIGAAILTDPLTYLTGGLSVLAKGAKGAEVLRTSETFRAAMGAKKYEELTVGGARDLARKSMRDAPADELPGLQRAAGDLDKIGDGDLLLEGLKQHQNKRELAIGLPFYEKFGLGKSLDTKYNNWWQVHNDVWKKGGRLAMGYVPDALKSSAIARPFRAVNNAVKSAVQGYAAGGRLNWIYDTRNAWDRDLAAVPEHLVDLMDDRGVAIYRQIDKSGGLDEVIERFEDFEPRLAASRERLADFEGILGRHKLAGRVLNPQVFNKASYATLRGWAKTLGVKTAGKGRTKEVILADLKVAAKEARQPAEWPKQLAREIKREKEAIAKGETFTLHDRLLHALGYDPKRGSAESAAARADSYWAAITGSSSASVTADPKLFRSGIESFVTRMDDAHREVISHRVVGKETEHFTHLTEAGVRGDLNKRLFEGFRAFRTATTKALQTDSGLKNYQKHTDKMADRLARATVSVDHRAAAIERNIPAAAKEMDMPIDTFEEYVRAILETAPHTDEPSVLVSLATQDPKKFQSAVWSYINRATKYLHSGALALRAQGGNHAADAAESVAALGRGLLDKKIVQVRFEERLLEAGYTPQAVEPLMRNEVESYRLRARLDDNDRFTHERLGYLSTEDLLNRRESLELRLGRTEVAPGKFLPIRVGPGEKLRATRPGKGTRRTKKGGEELQVLQDDIAQLTQMIHMRAMGLKRLPPPKKGQARPAKVLRDPLDPKALQVQQLDGTGKPVWVRGDTDSLSTLGWNQAMLGARAHELARLSAKGIQPPTALLSEIERHLQVIGRHIENTARGEMGKAGKGVLDEIRDMQAEILDASYRSGVLSAGAPIAYVPRILSREGARQLHRILGGTPESTIRKFSSDLAATHARDLDSLTIDELNELVREYRKVGDEERAKKIDEVFAGEGKSISAYEKSPFTSIYTRLAQVKETDNTANFVNTLIGDMEKGGKQAAPLFRARVVGFVKKGPKSEVVYRSEAIKAKLQQLEDEGGKFKPLHINGDDTKELVTEASSLVIEYPDGRVGTLALADISEGRVLMAPTRAHSFADAKGADIGTTVSNLAAHGELNDLLVRNGDDIRDERSLLNMLDQEIIYGDQYAAEGMLNSLRQQYKVGGQFGMVYDQVHNFVKKFQTVFTPGFHTANLASGFFQSLTAGHSAKDTTLGMMDALRFLSDSKDWARKYDPTINRLGDGSGFTKPGLVGHYLEGVRAIRRTSHRAGGTKAELVDGLDEYVFSLKGTGRSYDMSELLDAIIGENLFATYISEGLRGQVRISGAVDRIRRYARVGEQEKVGARVKAMVGKGVGEAGERTEASEVAVRLMNFFAGVRSGLDPRTAAAVSAEANVQYARLTSLEKQVAKRAFTYYTFPRKFIPYAWRRFSEDPSQASVMAHSLMGALEDGIAVDASGQVSLRVGDEKRFRLNIQRSHAGVDAMFALPALVNFLVPGKIPGEEITGVGDLPAFAQLGPVAESIVGAFSEKKPTDPSWTEELPFLIPHIRWMAEALGPGDPERETTLFESAVMDKVFKTKKQRVAHEERLYRSRYSVVENSIKQDLHDALAFGDKDRADDLKEELRKLSTVYSRKVKALRD